MQKLYNYFRIMMSQVFWQYSSCEVEGLVSTVLTLIWGNLVQKFYPWDVRVKWLSKNLKWKINRAVTIVFGILRIGKISKVGEGGQGIVNTFFCHIKSILNLIFFI